MQAHADTVELRLGPGSRGDAVAGPLVLALGSRAGLTVQQLDELELAVEMLLRHRGDAPATVTIAVEGDALVLAVSPVPEEVARRRSAILEQLAGRIELSGERVELRAGG
jgi:hypothetical protein